MATPPNSYTTSWDSTSPGSVALGYWATPEALAAYVLKIKLPSLVHTALLAEGLVVALGVGDSGQLDVCLCGDAAE